MIRWKDKHAYNWIGIGENLHKRYDTLPIGIQILTSPLYILLGILFTLHTMEWLMNLYCDMSERLLQKPNGLWSIMKVIVLIPSLPMIAYALPGWIYDKVKSRKVHISNDPWEGIENRMEQSRVHRVDYFIPLREDVKDFLPKKSMKSHKLTKDKVEPRVYRLPWEGFRNGGEEFDWGTNEYER
tara:strand:+ start:226 stop:777 length:552 start_codon:yes stop_codon:yes gene_type:complete